MMNAIKIGVTPESGSTEGPDRKPQRLCTFWGPSLVNPLDR